MTDLDGELDGKLSLSVVRDQLREARKTVIRDSEAHIMIDNIIERLPTPSPQDPSRQDGRHKNEDAPVGTPIYVVRSTPAKNQDQLPFRHEDKVSVIVVKQIS